MTFPGVISSSVYCYGHEYGLESLPVLYFNKTKEMGLVYLSYTDFYSGCSQSQVTTFTSQLLSSGNNTRPLKDIETEKEV